MEAQWALAFVARRAGTPVMEESRWRHVMSLELGWMPPGQAGRYVTACRRAGLLVDDGDMLRLGFDAKAVEVPRGFRPDPAALPAMADAPSGPATPAADAHPAASTPASMEKPGGPEDLFSAWLPKVAAARGEDIGATLAAVEAQQEASGGLLHAEPALLRLGAEAGLDVRAAANEALKRLQA